jgi:uncharacterized protein (TIGR02611 family)
MPPSTPDRSEGDGDAPIHTRREHLRDELQIIEQAAIDAELETGRREETVEQAKRHLLLRAARVSAGTVVLAVGIALLALPGPGLVVIAIGLGLLSQDVPFARRMLLRVRERLPEGEDGNVSTRFIAVSVVISVVAIGFSIWWTFLR